MRSRWLCRQAFLEPVRDLSVDLTSRKKQQQVLRLESLVEGEPQEVTPEFWSTLRNELGRNRDCPTLSGSNPDDI
jgi:hypothetical protein